MWRWSITTDADGVRHYKRIFVAQPEFGKRKEAPRSKYDPVNAPRAKPTNTHVRPWVWFVLGMSAIVVCCQRPQAVTRPVEPWEMAHESYYCPKINPGAERCKSYWDEQRSKRK